MPIFKEVRTIKAKVIHKYRDMQLNGDIKNPGDVIEGISKERLDHLVNKGFVVEVKETKKAETTPKTS